MSRGDSVGRDPVLTAMTLVSLIVLFIITFPLVVASLTSFNPTAEAAFPPQGLSLRWFENMFRESDLVAAFWFSLVLAVTTTILSLVLGGMSAFALTRGSFFGKTAIDAMLMSPLLVPQVIIGLSFLILFVRIDATQPFANLLLLHLTLTLPYALRVIRSGLARVDPKLEEAAKGLGASGFQSAVMVTVPQIRPSLAVAAFFCFVVSFDNFTASAFVTISGATLPIKMFFYIESNVDPTISAISALLIASTAVFVYVADRIVGIDKII